MLTGMWYQFMSVVRCPYRVLDVAVTSFGGLKLERFVG